MTQHYRSKGYKDNFNSANLQALLSSIKLSNKNFVFNNQGPIDMIVNLREKPVEFKYRGKLIKPFNLIRENVKVQIYKKTDRVVSLSVENITGEKFEVESEGILYPIGLFIKVEMDNCKPTMIRLQTNALTINIPKAIPIIPLFSDD